MPVSPFTIVEHEDKSRNRKEIQQMHPYRKSHQERYEDNPSVGIRRIRLLVPFGHRPEDDGGEQR